MKEKPVDTITVNQEFLAQLRAVNELTVLRDGGGNPLGLFTPIASEANKNSSKTYTTREVFELFLSLTTDEKMRSHLLKLIEGVKERDACATP
jgi:hypothetical protein